MPVSDVTQAQQTVAAQNNQTSRNFGKDLGKDDFLKILVAQLQNQDPLSPMEDTDFIAQLAQFSSLEQMQSLNSSFTFGQAYSLVGKNIYTTVQDASGMQQPVFGKVTGVLSSKGAAYLEIDGANYVPFTNDIVVYEPDIGVPQTPPAVDSEETEQIVTTNTSTVTAPIVNTQTAEYEPGTAETENTESQVELNQTTATSGSEQVISLGDPSTRVMDY